MLPTSHTSTASYRQLSSPTCLICDIYDRPEKLYTEQVEIVSVSETEWLLLNFDLCV